jgi:hypothetical protein
MVNNSMVFSLFYTIAADYFDLKFNLNGTTSLGSVDLCELLSALESRFISIVGCSYSKRLALVSRPGTVTCIKSSVVYTELTIGDWYK